MRAHKKCRHCGEYLTPAIRPRAVAGWNPGVAALLSLFLPGAGQMYKGTVGVGFAWLIGTIIAYTFLVVPGVILHVICIVNAATESVARPKA